ncbi:MAG TPA: hypothetical protein PKY60_15625, partial [Thermoflexales bacterium]|nr:hypothetical protein [Thermoflexales bacterium]
MFVWNKAIGIAVSVGILFSPLAAPAGAAQFSPENNKVLDAVFADPVPLKPSTPLACPVIATNVNTGLTFCSIQEANDAPTTLAGHTISVMAGSYTTQTSTINKSLTIIGAGTGVTLDGVNATRVMTATDTAITLTLQNITMTHGNGAGSLYSGYGGCLYTDAQTYSGGSVVLDKIGFVSCAASMYGGGAYVNSSATISASQFTSNTATVHGGGAYINDSTFITASQFTRNTSNVLGGGAFVDGSAVVSSSQFFANTGLYGGGGYIRSDATISASQFTSNTVQYEGGGVWVFGNGTINASQFTSNTAQSGGGAFIASTATISASQFSRNMAQQNGGGAYMNGSPTISGSQFTSNTAQQNGGGAYMSGNAAISASQFVTNTAQQGGGAFISSGTGSIVNSLFARNAAFSGLGDAIYICDPAVGLCGNMSIVFTTIANPTLMAGSAVYVGSATGATLNVTNTIIVSHTIGISNTRTVNEDYNYFNANPTKIVTSGGGVTNSGPNHPAGAQKFVNPAGDDWRLVTGNPAINTGTNAGVYTDYFGN